MIGRWNYMLRTVVLGGLVALLGWGGWEVRGLVRRHDAELADRDAKIAGLETDVADRDLRIEELGLQVATLEEEVRALRAAMRLLKVDHRLARLTVLEQNAAADVPGGTETVVEFQELDSEGEPLGEGRTVTIAGKLAYLDALVIKFDDDYVEQGDALRGSSICLFRRLFGEYQWPSEGTPLDAVGTRPPPYAGDDAQAPWEIDLWRRFWDYANDPEAAAALGVRAMHGEAPYVELRPGGRYLVELRASGGLSVRPESVR